MNLIIASLSLFMGVMHELVWFGLPGVVLGLSFGVPFRGFWFLWVWDFRVLGLVCVVVWVLVSRVLVLDSVGVFFWGWCFLVNLS